MSKHTSKPTVEQLAGAIVRERRQAALLTQVELAELAAFSGSNVISKIERGNAVTLSNLATIARALGLETKELIP